MITKKRKPNLRKIQAEKRRLQILDTAISVFAARGFANTSIKDLADAAGISSGLMYHYFTGKEKLLEAAVEHNSFLPQLRALLKDTKHQPYQKVLKNIAVRFINLLEEKNEIFMIFLQEGFTNTNVQKVWSNLANEGMSLLKQYIADCIAAGELRDHDPEVTARCLFSIIIAFQLTRDIFKTSQVTRTQFIDTAIDNLLYGIKRNQ